MYIGEAAKKTRVPTSRIRRRLRAKLYGIDVKTQDDAWTQYPDDLPKHVIVGETLLALGSTKDEVRTIASVELNGIRTDEERAQVLKTAESLAQAAEALNYMLDKLLLAAGTYVPHDASASSTAGAESLPKRRILRDFGAKIIGFFRRQERSTL